MTITCSIIQLHGQTWKMSTEGNSTWQRQQDATVIHLTECQLADRRSDLFHINHFGVYLTNTMREYIICVYIHTTSARTPTMAFRSGACHMADSRCWLMISTNSNNGVCASLANYHGLNVFRFDCNVTRPSHEMRKSMSERRRDSVANIWATFVTRNYFRVPVPWLGYKWQTRLL